MSETTTTSAPPASGSLLNGGGGAPAPGGAAPAAPDWLPAEFHGDPAFKDFKDVAGLAKSFKDTQAFVGLDKTQILRLPKDEAAAEWTEVWAKLGRPESPDGYDFKAPEGLDEDTVKAFRAKLHEAGVPKRQAAAIMEFYGGRLQQMQEAHVQAEQAAVQTTVQSLKKEWGAAYTERVERLEQFVIQSAGPEATEAVDFLVKSGRTDVLNMLAKAAEATLEPTGLKGGQTGGMGRSMTPAEARSEIGTLEASEEYQKMAYAPRDTPGRAELMARRDRLYEMAYSGGKA